MLIIVVTSGIAPGGASSVQCLVSADYWLKCNSLFTFSFLFLPYAFILKLQKNISKLIRCLQRLLEIYINPYIIIFHISNKKCYFVIGF